MILTDLHRMVYMEQLFLCRSTPTFSRALFKESFCSQMQAYCVFAQSWWLTWFYTSSWTLAPHHHFSKPVSFQCLEFKVNVKEDSCTILLHVLQSLWRCRELQNFGLPFSPFKHARLDWGLSISQTYSPVMFTDCPTISGHDTTTIQDIHRDDHEEAPLDSRQNQ